MKAPSHKLVVTQLYPSFNSSSIRCAAGIATCFFLHQIPHQSVPLVVFHFEAEHNRRFTYYPIEVTKYLYEEKTS
jgi:hypothetical protein